MEKRGELSIEDALAELEEVIRKLENKDCTLEESFKLYQHGTSLISRCSLAFSEIEQKLIILNKEGETNEF